MKSAWLPLVFSLCCGPFAAADEMEYDLKLLAYKPIAGDFRLVDQHGASQSMAYYSDFSFLLLVGYDMACRDSNKLGAGVMKQLGALENAHKLKTFFLAPDSQDRREDWPRFALQGQNYVPVLSDPTKSITRSLGILKAGDFVLLRAADFSVAGTGSINNFSCIQRWLDLPNGTFSCPAGVMSRSLSAVSELTGLSHCALDTSPLGGLTYADAAPVLAKNCLECHSSNTYGDFSSYKKVMGWSAMIRQVLRTGFMPPGAQDFHYSGYVNDFSPADQRIVIDWIEAGAPRGTGEDLLERVATKMDLASPYGPALPNPGEKPEFVFKQKVPHSVPAEGIVSYQYEQIAGPFSRDVYIKGIDVNVNERVAHHTNIFVVDEPLSKLKNTMMEGVVDKTARVIQEIHDRKGKLKFEEERTLLITARGRDRNSFLPDGLAYLVPKGKYLVMEFHYTPTGKQEKSSAMVQIFTYPKERTRGLLAVRKMALMRTGFSIPPGAPDFRVRNQVILDRDVTVLGFRPHFHYRGMSFRVIAQLPDGSELTLFSIPHFQTKFQQIYYLRKGVFLPRGTALDMPVSYDNSKQNPQNPDPTAYVPIGQQTISDEMHRHRILYVEGRYEGGLVEKPMQDVISREISGKESSK